MGVTYMQLNTSLFYYKKKVQMKFFVRGKVQMN